MISLSSPNFSMTNLTAKEDMEKKNISDRTMEYLRLEIKNPHGFRGFESHRFH